MNESKDRVSQKFLEIGNGCGGGFDGYHNGQHSCALYDEKWDITNRTWNYGQIAESKQYIIVFTKLHRFYSY